MTSRAPGVVYFIWESLGSHVKIGWSANPISRLHAMQIGNPAELRLLLTTPGDQELEEQLHARFRADRVRGEWFRCSDALKAFLTTEALSLTGTIRWNGRRSDERTTTMPFFRGTRTGVPDFIAARESGSDGTQADGTQADGTQDGAPSSGFPAESGGVPDAACGGVLDTSRAGGDPHSMSFSPAGEGETDRRRRGDVSDETIARLRAEGVSWSGIAGRTGLSRSGARQRWLAITGQGRARDA